MISIMLSDFFVFYHASNCHYLTQLSCHFVVLFNLILKLIFLFIFLVIILIVVYCSNFCLLHFCLTHLFFSILFVYFLHIFFSEKSSSEDELNNWKSYFFQFLYATGLFKEPSSSSSSSSSVHSLRSEEEKMNNSSRSNDYSSNDNTNNNTRKKGNSIYKNVLNFFGIRAMRSSNEEYELVQNYTDSLGTDSTHDTSDHGEHKEIH